MMNDHLIEKAFRELYPDKEFQYIPVIKYSGKFSGFNANIRLGINKIEMHMSKVFIPRKWNDHTLLLKNIYGKYHTLLWKKISQFCI